MLVVFLLIAGLTLAFANGANDHFKATATLYGSGELDFDASRRLATIAQIAGSLASLFWAQALLRSFGGKGLVPDAVVADPLFLIAVGSGAATTVLLALIATSGLSPLAHRLRRRYGIETSSCLCIGAVQEPVQIAADGTLVLARTGLALALDETARCRDLYAGSFLGLRLQSIAERFHQSSAFALGFARALNDTPKVLALVVTAGWSGLDPRLSLGIIAAVMAVGGWLRAERVAETLSHRITSFRPGPGLLANSVASLLVIGASLAGSPVSTTHVSTGAIFGIGLSSASTDWKVVGGIVAAWIGTLPLAAALAAAVAQVASRAFA